MHEETYPWARYESIDLEMLGIGIEVSATRVVCSLIETRSELKNMMTTAEVKVRDNDKCFRPMGILMV